jgi:hypothetical protein
MNSKNLEVKVLKSKSKKFFSNLEPKQLFSDRPFTNNNFKNIEELLTSYFGIECRYIGCGIERATYSLGEEYALKICLYNNPNQNITEIKNYRKILRQPKSIRKYFVPLLGYSKDGRWLLVGKAKVKTDNEDYKDSLTSEEVKVISNKLHKVFCKYNINIVDTCSNDENVGEYKGQPVVIDLGFKLEFNSKRCKD